MQLPTEDGVCMLGSGANASKKSVKQLGMAMDEDEEDFFADMVVDDLDEVMEGAAAAPKPASEDNVDAGNKPDEAAAVQAKAAAPAMHRPPRHPGKPTAVQQVQAHASEPSVGAQDSCSMDAVQEQEEQESPAADEALAPSPAPAAKPTAAAGAGAIAPAAHPSRSPSSSSKAPRSNDAVAAADAVTAAAAAAAAPTQPFDSEPQLDASRVLAKMRPPSAAGPQPQAPPTLPPGQSEAQMGAWSAPAAAAAPPKAAAAASSLGAAARQAPPAKLQGALPPMAASKMAVPSKTVAAPSLVAGGSTAQFNALLAKTGAPAGGSSLGLSRLGQPAAGSKPAAFTLLPAGQPKQGGMSWVRQQPPPPPAGKQPAPNQYMAAPALPQRLQAGQAQVTPGSALPKHMQSAAVPAKAATPAPVTPAGDAAAASAAATAAAQEAEQEQLRRAAIQEDRLLAFDFAGTVSAVLQDHQQAAQASAEQAAPITDAVQEQLLVLDQLSMQAEALRRQIGGLRVDLTIYSSSLAFMDDPRVSCSFDGIEDKVRELWEPLASYEPPRIEAPQPQPPPPPPAEDDQQEQAMADAVPEESGPLVDELLGLDEGEPAELAMLEAPQPDGEAAAAAEAARTAEQPSQVAPTVDVAPADSEMEDGLAEGSSGGEDGSMDSMEEEQASCEEQASGEEQASEEGSEEEQYSGEEQGSEEQHSEEQGSEEQHSEEQGSEAEKSQPALPPTQAVESASPGAATEPPLEKPPPQSKEGSLVLSFDSELASSDVEEAEAAVAPVQAAVAAAAAEPAVSVSLEGGANGEVKLSLQSFYAAGQPTLQGTLG